MKTAWISLLLLCGLPALAGPCDKADQLPTLGDDPCAEDVAPEPTGPLLTVNGTYYEDNNWSATVVWHWDLCVRVKPGISYLRLNDVYGGLESTETADYRSGGYRPTAPPPDPTAILANEGAWGLTFSIDIGKRRR